MTIIERVKKIIKWLIYSGFGENEKEIAELLGYTKSSFSQIMNGKVPLSDKFIDKLCSIDKNINKVWINTGEGKILNDNYSIDQDNKAEESKIELLEEIRQLSKENRLLLKENTKLESEISSLRHKNEELKKEINYLSIGKGTAVSKSDTTMSEKKARQ